MNYTGVTVPDSEMEGSPTVLQTRVLKEGKGGAGEGRGGWGRGRGGDGRVGPGHVGVNVSSSRTGTYIMSVWLRETSLSCQPLHHSVGGGAGKPD